MNILDVPCPTCGHLNKRTVDFIHPLAFISPEEAGLTSAFWCKGEGCDQQIRARYIFLQDGEVEKVLVKSIVKHTNRVLEPLGSGITIKPKQKSYRR